MDMSFHYYDHTGRELGKNEKFQEAAELVRFLSRIDQIHQDSEPPADVFSIEDRPADSLKLI